MSIDQANEFRVALKASYLEGIRSPEEDQNELETRLRKARLVDIRRQLKQDRQRYEKANKTDLTLKQRLLSQLQATEGIEAVEAATLQLQATKKKIAEDKADAFAGSFLNALDVPGGIASASNTGPTTDSAFGRMPSVAETSVDGAALSARADKELNAAMNAAMRSAFQQGVRQHREWNQEEAGQDDPASSNLEDKLANRLLAAKKVASVAAGEAAKASQSHRRHRKRSSLAHGMPAKTVSALTSNFVSNQRLFIAKDAAIREEHEFKSKQMMLERQRNANQPARFNTVERNTNKAIDSQVVYKQRQLAEVRYDKEKAALHREARLKERIGHQKGSAQTSLANLPPLPGALP